MEKDEKLEQWSKMEADQKRKFNGFDGFCNNAYFSQDNAFMQEDKDKLKRRSEKETTRRNKNGKN